MKHDDLEFARLLEVYANLGREDSDDVSVRMLDCWFIQSNFAF
jgi:hypothetical protein